MISTIRYIYHKTSDVRIYDDCTRVVEQTIKELGRLDILINGAAGNFLCAAEDLSSNAFKTGFIYDSFLSQFLVIEIDLLGTFYMSKAAFSSLKATKGNIINISATLHYHTTPWQTHASAAKVDIRTHYVNSQFFVRQELTV